MGANDDVLTTNQIVRRAFNYITQRHKVEDAESLAALEEIKSVLDSILAKETEININADAINLNTDEIEEKLDEVNSNLVTVQNKQDEQTALLTTIESNTDEIEPKLDIVNTNLETIQDKQDEQTVLLTSIDEKVATALNQIFNILNSSKWMDLGVYDEVNLSVAGNVSTLNYYEQQAHLGQALITFVSPSSWSLAMARYITDDDGIALQDDDSSQLNLD